MMDLTIKPTITIEATINAPVEKVWNEWINADAIVKWNAASPDWHTTKAEHDLNPGGMFKYRMEAKDGSFGFDFGGVFNTVKPNEYLESTIADGRKIKTTLSSEGNATTVSQTFEAEETHSVEQQREGWQAILNNFKAYVESQSN